MSTTKVLIIENEMLVATEISMILEEEGFETVIGVTNVQAAFEKLDNEKFDLVLIDINLDGELSGCVIGKYLLQKDTTSYIYITALYDPETIETIKTTRPHGIIIKPFKAIDITTTTAIVLNNYFYKDIDVLRDLPNYQHLDKEIPFVIKKIISYIDDNIYEKIEIQDLVKMTKWTNIHLTNLFTRYIGVTPYKYILQRKIEQAKIVIVNSDLNMREIATDLCFDSYSNFFNAFKKYTGYTPEEYKKNNLLKKYLK